MIRVETNCLLRTNVFRSGSFFALADFILYDLAVFKAFEAFHFNTRVMDEKIFSTIVGGNKTEPLMVTEPFNSTFLHVGNLHSGILLVEEHPTYLLVLDTQMEEPKQGEKPQTLLNAPS